MDAQKLAQMLQMQQERQAQMQQYTDLLDRTGGQQTYQNMPLPNDFQQNYQYLQGGVTDRDRQFAQEQMNQPMQNPGFPPVVAMPQMIPQQNMFGGQVVPMLTTEEKPNFISGRSVPMPTVGGMGQLSAQDMEYIRSLSR
jgi:hypothetical protein